MSTVAELLAIYSNQSQMSSYFTDKLGILSILSYTTSVVYDGVTSAYNALYDAIDDIPTSGGIIMLPSTENGGEYLVDSNITIPANVTLWIPPGAKIKRGTGKVITLYGQIMAGNYNIFSGSGTINMQLSPTPHNIAWFPGDSLNEKWDDMSATFTDKIQKTVIIPKPYPNQDGAVLNTSTVQLRWSWKLDDTWIIDDNCSNIFIHCEGEIYVPTNIGTAVVIGMTSQKIENIDFPLGVCITANSTNRITTGIEVRGCARLYLRGRTDISYADYSCILGGVNQAAPVGEVEIHDFHCAFNRYEGITLNGLSATVVTNIKIINSVIDNTIDTNSNCVIIKGNIRNIDILGIYYNTNTATYPKDLVTVESTTEGSPYHIALRNLYASNISRYALLTKDSSVGTASKISNLFINGIRTIGGTEIKLGYAYQPAIENMDPGLQITIDADTQYAQIKTSNRCRTITDNSSNAVINGAGSKPYGGGVIPNTLEWAQGNIVTNTTDGKVFLKYRHTGVDANDFIALN